MWSEKERKVALSRKAGNEVIMRLRMTPKCDIVKFNILTFALHAIPFAFEPLRSQRGIVYMAAVFNPRYNRYAVSNGLGETKCVRSHVQVIGTDSQQGESQKNGTVTTIPLELRHKQSSVSRSSLM